jgi:UDP-glucose 4-epimerase
MGTKSAILIAGGAAQQLGFVPKLSELAPLIRSAWAWRQTAHPRLV